MFTAFLYAEKIKLAADVRKKKNVLMTVRYISILKQYFVCIWSVSNSKRHMKCGEHITKETRFQIAPKEVVYLTYVMQSWFKKII